MKVGDRVVEPLVPGPGGIVEKIKDPGGSLDRRVLVEWSGGIRSWHWEGQLRPAPRQLPEVGTRVRGRITGRTGTVVSVVTGEKPEIWVAFDDGRATSLVDPRSIEEIPADLLKNGDRVRQTHRRVCHPDVFGTVVRFEIDSELGSRFWVVWDDDPYLDEAGPYTREELDRVNDLEAKEEIGPNKLELRAGEGKIELLVNGRDIAPEISPDWTLVPPNDLGEVFLEVRYPVEVPGSGILKREEPSMSEEWGLADSNGQVGPIFETVEAAKDYREKHPAISGWSRIARRFVSQWEVGE